MSSFTEQVAAKGTAMAVYDLIKYYEGSESGVVLKGAEEAPEIPCLLYRLKDQTLCKLGFDVNDEEASMYVTQYKSDDTILVLKGVDEIFDTACEMMRDGSNWADLQAAVNAIPAAELESPVVCLEG